MFNLLKLEGDERIASVLCLRDIEEEQDYDLIFCSKNGLIKRTSLSAYKNIRKNGLRAYNCGEGDELLTVQLSRPDQDILITTKDGTAIVLEANRFVEWAESVRVFVGLTFGTRTRLPA